MRSSNSALLPENLQCGAVSVLELKEAGLRAARGANGSRGGQGRAYVRGTFLLFISGPSVISLSVAGSNMKSYQMGR